MTDLSKQGVVLPTASYIHPVNINRKIRKNLVGQRFGFLTVLSLDLSRANFTRYMCECDCGEVLSIRGEYLPNGHTRSCGCLTNRPLSKRHNMASFPEYRVWQGMKARCTSPTSSGFYLYGGRGITVCDRWMKSFYNFYEDMGRRPPKMSLDRIDNNLGYSKSNCRWATSVEQSINKRKTVMFEAFGIKKCREHWGKLLGVRPSTIDYHLRRGKTLEDFIEFRKSKDMIFL